MNRNDINKIWQTDSAIYIELNDGRQGFENFVDYARLAKATKIQRENFRLSHFGIHWPDIDEDLSFDGFFNKL